MNSTLTLKPAPLTLSGAIKAMGGMYAPGPKKLVIRIGSCNIDTADAQYELAREVELLAATELGLVVSSATNYIDVAAGQSFQQLKAACEFRPRPSLKGEMDWSSAMRLVNSTGKAPAKVIKGPIPEGEWAAHLALETLGYSEEDGSLVLAGYMTARQVVNAIKAALEVTKTTTKKPAATPKKVAKPIKGQGLERINSAFHASAEAKEEQSWRDSKPNGKPGKAACNALLAALREGDKTLEECYAVAGALYPHQVEYVIGSDAGKFAIVGGKIHAK